MTEISWADFAIRTSSAQQTAHVLSECLTTGAPDERGDVRSDARGRPSYLMTESERNVRFYGRYGFAVVEASAMDAGAPTIWIMVREAGAGLVPEGDRV